MVKLEEATKKIKDEFPSFETNGIWETSEYYFFSLKEAGGEVVCDGMHKLNKVTGAIKGYSPFVNPELIRSARKVE